MKPEDVNAFVVVTAILKWIGFLGAALLFYWLFLPYLDKWIVQLLNIWR